MEKQVGCYQLPMNCKSFLNYNIFINNKKFLPVGLFKNFLKFAVHEKSASFKIEEEFVITDST